MMDLDTRLEALSELYDSLPTIACKGRCANSCGPIDMSEAERTRILVRGKVIPIFTEEAARRWANDEPLHCPALNRRTLKCDVYDARPLICRMWGVAESMTCPHGCVPSRLLTLREQFEYILRSYEIGGHRHAEKMVSNRQMIDMLDDPEVGPLMERFVKGDRTVERELLPAIQRYHQEHADV